MLTFHGRCATDRLVSEYFFALVIEYFLQLSFEYTRKCRIVYRMLLC